LVVVVVVVLAARGVGAGAGFVLTVFDAFGCGAEVEEGGGGVAVEVALAALALTTAVVGGASVLTGLLGDGLRLLGDGLRSGGEGVAGCKTDGFAAGARTGADVLAGVGAIGMGVAFGPTAEVGGAGSLAGDAGRAIDRDLTAALIGALGEASGAGFCTAAITASTSACDMTSSNMPTAEGISGGERSAFGSIELYIGVSSERADMCKAMGERAEGV
jgi:hypothetical protein